MACVTFNFSSELFFHISHLESAEKINNGIAGQIIYFSVKHVKKSPACCEKYLNDNKHNGFHLARKYARMFFLGENQFHKARSFPRASDSGHIFAPDGSFCLHIPSRRQMKFKYAALIKMNQSNDCI